MDESLARYLDAMQAAMTAQNPQRQAIQQQARASLPPDMSMSRIPSMTPPVGEVQNARHLVEGQPGFSDPLANALKAMFTQTPVTDTLVTGAKRFAEGGTIPESFMAAMAHLQEQGPRYGQALQTGEFVPHQSFTEIEGMPQWAGIVGDIGTGLFDVGGAVGRLVRGVRQGAQALKNGGRFIRLADDAGDGLEDAMTAARRDFSDDALADMARPSRVSEFGDFPYPVEAAEALRRGELDGMLLRTGTTQAEIAETTAQMDRLITRLDDMPLDDFKIHFGQTQPGRAGTIENMGDEAWEAVRRQMVDDLQDVHHRFRAADQAETYRAAGRMHTLEGSGIRRIDDIDINAPGDLEAITRSNYDTLAGIGAAGDHIDSAIRPEALRVLSEHTVDAMTVPVGTSPDRMLAWLDGVSALGDEYGTVARTIAQRIRRTIGRDDFSIGDAYGGIADDMLDLAALIRAENTLHTMSAAAVYSALRANPKSAPVMETILRNTISMAESHAKKSGITPSRELLRAMGRADELLQDLAFRAPSGISGPDLSNLGGTLGRP